MKQDEQLIWNYLDGQCTPAQRAAIKKRLTEDDAFHAAYLERRQLHTSLQKQEAEQPSLRFAKNVMDRLPLLYRRTVEPLVRPFWIKVFAGALGAFLLVYLGGVIYSLQHGLVSGEDPAARVGSQVSDFLSGLPTQAFYVIMALSISYLFLVFLDRKLKRMMVNDGQE